MVKQKNHINQRTKNVMLDLNRLIGNEIDAIKRDHSVIDIDDQNQANVKAAKDEVWSFLASVSEAVRVQKTVWKIPTAPDS
ncbi:MAG: hypothetical protein WC325_10730 [Candidatus Bathyarchaeia archaeon]|jgi:hypothetical protein